MKKHKKIIIIISTFIVHFAYSQNNTITFDELSFTDSQSGIGKLKDNSKTGNWKYYYTDKKLWKEGNFNNNKEDGIWIVYYKNGKIREKKNYKNGILNGISESFYESGKIRFQSNYIDGKLNGEFKELFEDGKIHSIQNYSNGKKTGNFIEYNKDGKIESKEIFDANKSVRKYIKYYKNGNIEEEGFIEGEGYSITGVYKKYFENGTLQMHALMNDNRLLEIIEYNDIRGNKLDPGTLKNGNGIYKYYNDEGKFLGSYEFENGRPKK